MFTIICYTNIKILSVANCSSHRLRIRAFASDRGGPVGELADPVNEDTPRRKQNDLYYQTVNRGHTAASYEKLGRHMPLDGYDRVRWCSDRQTERERGHQCAWYHQVHWM